MEALHVLLEEILDELEQGLIVLVQNVKNLIQKFILFFGVAEDLHI